MVVWGAGGGGGWGRNGLALHTEINILLKDNKMFQKYFIVCGNVRSCYKRPAVKQVVKIPTVLIERGIPYAQIRSPPLLLSFQHVVLKVTIP